VRIFGRSWSVQVGELDVSDLRVAFKVTRTLMARAGTCELTISNLTEAHRREITTAPRRRTFVEIQAGYLEGRSTIFRGDLRKAIPAREGADWVVKVTAGDGEHALRTARVGRSFARGTSMGTVVQAIADAMGVGIGNAREALRGAQLGSESTFPAGTVLFGSAASELTKLCESAGLSWSVQDGNLQVIPLGGSLARTAILLSPDTGMYESPEIVNRRTITVKAALIPGLVPGQLVVVESSVATGSWRITEAAYAGDTGGAEWGATLTCHRPRPPLVGSAISTTPNQE